MSLAGPEPFSGLGLEEDLVKGLEKSIDTDNSARLDPLPGLELEEDLVLTKLDSIQIKGERLPPGIRFMIIK